MPTHTERCTVRPHETGWDKKLRVQCLCNYLEDAAHVHAEKLGVGLDRLYREDMSWALAKMRVNIIRRPAAGETLRVVTWPVGLEHAFFRRDFAIYAQGRELITSAVTQWVIINLSSRRLAHFPAYIAALAPRNPRLPRTKGDIRIPVPGEAARTGPSFPVRLADIDRNRHVNNGRFVDFVMESATCTGLFGEELPLDASLRQLELVFRSEGRIGDLIACRSEREEMPEADPKSLDRSGQPDNRSGLCLIHSLTRTADGRELARGRTVFGGENLI
ncbi:MAG: hypothetical protein LBN33_06935 [Desulfovibrio sp.]|jgi:acyl-ACP thioesterase|nr:hypothetical protein [Desulfovibrio sp.]